MSLIGLHSGKILDVIVKSSYYKQCEYLKDKYNSAEFELWMESPKEKCSANYEGSPGKMEVDGAIEMFKWSVDLHGVKYLSYIGDNNCKTYKSIVESQPYGENITKIKKECVRKLV